MDKKLLLGFVFLFLVVSANGQVTTYFSAKGKVVKVLDKADYYTVVQADVTKENRTLELKYSKLGLILSESRYFLQNDNVRLLDGLNKEWYDNGQLHLEASYDMNKLNGKLKSYSVDGKVIRDEEYKNDRFLFDEKSLNGDRNNMIFDVVQKMPTFTGGDVALKNFISSNLKYPEVSKKKGIKGTVFVRFVINKTGDVVYVHIVKELDSFCNDEAVRIVKALPRWTPGMQNGFIVPTFCILQIHFGV